MDELSIWRQLRGEINRALKVLCETVTLFLNKKKKMCANDLLDNTLPQRSGLQGTSGKRAVWKNSSSLLVIRNSDDSDLSRVLQILYSYKSAQYNKRKMHETNVLKSFGNQ